MSARPRPLPTASREFHFPHFERRLLSNGLNLIVAPMNRLPVVTAMLVIDGGAVRENRGVEGVAELTARALLEGTKSKTADDLIQALEQLGTSITATADWDSTILRMTVLSPKLPQALALMSETVTSPRFDERSILRIRSERLSEIIQTKSEPRLLADEMFSSFVYEADVRYATPVGGTQKSVTGLAVADVLQYYGAAYRPGAATLILAGDVEVGKVVQLVGAEFGKWSGTTQRATVLKSDSTPGLSPRIHLVDRSGAKQSELRVGHVGVARSVSDYFQIVVMNAVLGGLFSSRINLNLREANGFTYGASSYFDWRRGNGPFVISTAVQSEVTGAAIVEVIREIEKIRDEEITEDELTLATSYLAGVFPIRYETTNAVASGLANLVIFNLPEDYFTAYRSRISGVTTREVREAAQRHLHPAGLSVVVVGSPSLVEPQLTALGFGDVLVHSSAE